MPWNKTNSSCITNRNSAATQPPDRRRSATSEQAGANLQAVVSVTPKWRRSFSSYYDPLTALPNCALLRDRAYNAGLGRWVRTKVALWIDLDRFNNIVDSPGTRLGRPGVVAGRRAFARLVVSKINTFYAVWEQQKGYYSPNHIDIIEKISNGFFGIRTPKSTLFHLIKLVQSINLMISQTKHKFDTIIQALENYGEYNFNYHIKQDDEKQRLNGDFGSLVAG